MKEACYQRSYCVRLDLQKEDHSRINKFLNKLGEDGDKKNTAFIRAMLFYMDEAETGDTIAQRRILRERLSSLEERIEKLEGQYAPDAKKKGREENTGECPDEGPGIKEGSGLSREDEAEIGEIARGFM